LREDIQIKELPKDWEWVKLGETLDIQGGSQPPKSTFLYHPKEGYIQLLQIRDFGEKGVPTYVPIKKVTKFCKKDDIMVARYGASLGRIITGLEGAYNVALAKVIDEKKLFEKRFIFYLFKTQIFQTPLKRLSRSAQNGFSKSELANIKLPLPPKKTQQSIVSKIEELFSELDKATENLRIAQQQLKTYRQAVLKWAFERGEQKAMPFEDIVISYQNGISKRSATTGAFFKVLRLADIKQAEIDSKEPREIRLTRAEIEKYTLEPNDIIVIRVNGSKELVGRFILVDTKDKWTFCDHFIRIKIDTERVLPKIIKYYAESRMVRKFIEINMVSSAGQNTISQATLSSLQIILPPLEYQQVIIEAIETRLSVADKMEESITQCLQQAEGVRQSILKKAFEGVLIN
jgi:type I restriction enzyme S subunit